MTGAWLSLLLFAGWGSILRCIWRRDIRARRAAEAEVRHLRHVNREQSTLIDDQNEHLAYLTDLIAAERGAHQDELALARHHRAAARQGLHCTWGHGVTNDPRNS